jgi:predicted Fe-Mo cluster-binding NifX family protein
MRVAYTIGEDFLCQKYCLCNKFVFLSVAPGSKKIIKEEHDAPLSETPGVMATWLNEHQVDAVVGKEIATLTKDCFETNGLKVIVISKSENAEQIAREYIQKQ